MSRVVKSFALITLIALVAALVGAAVFLSTDRFDEWAQTEATRYLENRFQIQAHFGRMDVHLWRERVVIDDLRLVDRLYPGPQPAVSVRRAVVRFSMLNYFFGELPLDEVSLDGLRLNLRRDPNDRVNLANMFSSRKPQTSTGGRFSPLKVKISSIHLRDAKVSYEDRLVEFNTNSQAFYLNLSYDPSVPSYDGSIELHALQLEVDDFPLPVTDFQSTFQVEQDGIRFESVRTSSTAVTSTMSGAITNFSPFEFDFNVDLTATLPQLRKPDLSSVFDRGAVNLQGRVQGSGHELAFDGDAHSDLLEIKGLALRNVVSKVHVDQDGARLRSMSFRVLGGSGDAESQIWWSASRQSTADLSSTGLQLAQTLQVFGVTGLPIDARNRLTAHLHWPGIRLTEFSGPGDLISEGQLIGDLAGRTESIPFSGKASLQFGDDRVRFDQGDIQTAQTEVSCEGSLTFDGETTLNANVRSRSSAEIWTAGRLFGFPPESLLSQYPVSLSGAFDGRVSLERKPGEPIQLEGSGETASVLFSGEPEGHLRTGFKLLPTQIQITGLQLVRSDSRVSADLVMNREPVFLESARVDADQVRLAELSRWGLISPSLGLTGRASLQTSLDFAPEWKDTTGTGTIELDDAGLDGVIIPSLKARMEVGGGDLRLSGILARLWGGSITGDASYAFSSGAIQTSLEGQDLSLAQSLLNRKQPELTGTVRLSLQGSGTWESPHVTLNLDSPEVHFGSETFAGVDIEGDYQNDKATFSARAGYLDRPVQIQASVQVASPYPFQAEASISDLTLTPFLKEFASFQLTDFSGSFGASVQASGNLADLTSISVQGSLPSLEFKVGDNGVHLTSPLSFTFRNDLLTVSPAGLVGRDTDITLGGTADFKQSELNFKVSGNVNLRLINAFLSQGDVQGEMHLETSIAGPIDAPKVVGSASLSGLFLGTPGLPVSIQDGHGQFKFTANQVSIDSFSARTDYGDFSASGGVFMNGFVPVRWQVNVTASDVTLPYPEGFTTILDADVDFAKGDKGELLSGAIYVRSAEFTKDVTIPELVVQLGKQSPVTAGGIGQGGIALDLSVEAYRSLRVSNNLADIVASGDFSVVGTVASPVVLGSLTIDEGKLKLEGNQYEIARGTINFDNPRKTSPYFNFEAETQVRDYDISIVIHGPLDQLKMTFQSEPPLSTANIVSLLAAGQTEQEILGTNTGAATSSGTLAAFGAGTLLTNTLGAAVQNQASRLFGIDRFSIDPFVDDNLSRDPGARITLGKQITQELGISYISSLANSFQEQTVVVEYQLTDWLTAVGTSQTDGTVAIDFKLRKRF